MTPKISHIIGLVFALLFTSFATFAADDFTGQFATELEAERENLDKVIFQPAKGRLNSKLVDSLLARNYVTFSYLYNPNNEKLEVPALLVEEEGETPYLWVDANMNKNFEETEKFPFKREEEDNPYIWNAIINLPLTKGVFKTFPLFVGFYREVKWDDMTDDDRLCVQSSEVYAKGLVDIQGKKTLVEYSYNPRERKISASQSKVAIDVNGDGEIDWGRFSGEAGIADGDVMVFRVGNLYLSHQKTDVEKNLIVLKSHPMTDYKRLELKVGDTFPDFEYKDFKGQKRRLSEFRGKYVLMDFWAIWCGPCRREMPYQKEAYKRYNARGFEILGMNADESDYISQTKSFLTKNNLEWTQATRESILPLMRALRIHLYPTALLLDPEGKVVSLDERKKGQLDLSGEDLLKSLQSVFFPAKASSKPTAEKEAIADTSNPAEGRPTLLRNSSKSNGKTNTFGDIRLPDPPAGFTWKAVEALKMFCAVPEDWKYKEEARSDGVTITISEDDAAAIEVITTVQKKVSGAAAEQANAMIEKISKGKQVAGKNQNQSGDRTQTMLVLQEGNQLIFHLFATNSKTNSLRHSTFECPFGRMESAGKIAQSVMTSMMMVE